MSNPQPVLKDLVSDTMRSGAELLSAGRALARDWQLGSNAFLRATGFPSEAAYKRATAASGRIMQHAHIGFRNVERTLWAMAEVHEKSARNGVTVDRFGITLDWSMGYPLAMREKAPRGTGIVLTGPEDFGRITNATPAAAHFGDFMLGLPGALENTQSAIAAGATSIGNLGQYFTFRLPYWDDDVATTEATVTAIGLIAAQDAEILVHSNLDDGFAGLFLDMCCSLGMVIVEKYIVEELMGARLAHCYGHHFSDPLSRTAFHFALNAVTDTPGTMLFGNTVSYQSTDAGNYASLSSYLMADILALSRWPTGHAINPVPVTENSRIPDVEEIIDAQTFATRLTQHAPFYDKVFDWAKVETLGAELVAGGQQFARNVLKGMADIGVDTSDPAQLMLAIRRLGPKRMEQLYGPGLNVSEQRQPMVLAEWAHELNLAAENWVRPYAGLAIDIRKHGLRACVGTSDVHEHGKYLVEHALQGLGVGIIDGGVAVDPEVLVQKAIDSAADFIAISTYNGVALKYCRQVMDVLRERGSSMPVIAGGKLNEIPQDSNTGLPVDVTESIREIGVLPCRSLDEMLPLIRGLATSA